MNAQNSQTRHSGSRLQQTTKPSMFLRMSASGSADIRLAIWSQQPTPQARDSAAAATENSWAAAMGGTRPTTQLDLSSSAFPSLNNSSQQSQNFNAGSAWQTGPPQSEQTRRQSMQALRPQASLLRVVTSTPPTPSHERHRTISRCQIFPHSLIDGQAQHQMGHLAWWRDLAN
jgi:hypothetical protein